MCHVPCTDDEVVLMRKSPRMPWSTDENTEPVPKIGGGGGGQWKDISGRDKGPTVELRSMVPLSYESFESRIPVTET